MTKAGTGLSKTGPKTLSVKKALVVEALFDPRKIKEGSAITDLFTFWRGWGHDVIMINITVRELSNKRQICQ